MPSATNSRTPFASPLIVRDLAPCAGGCGGPAKSVVRSVETKAATSKPALDGGVNSMRSAPRPGTTLSRPAPGVKAVGPVGGSIGPPPPPPPPPPAQPAMRRRGIEVLRSFIRVWCDGALSGDRLSVGRERENVAQREAVLGLGVEHHGLDVDG